MSESTNPGPKMHPDRLKAGKAPAPKRKIDKKQIKAEKRMKKRTARAEKRAAKVAAQELEGPKPKVPPLVKGQVKMQKMKMRVEKLEREGHQKLAKAKKLAAQVQAIIDAQNANPSESKSEDKDEDMLSISGSEAEEATSDSSADSDGGVDVSKQPTEVPPEVPADEVVMKHRRLSNAASERSHVETPAEAEPKKEKKSKKSKKAKEVEAEEEAVEAEADSEAEEPAVSEKKSKKAEKKRKRDSEAAAETSTKKEKKGKGKKEKEESSADAPAEQWHVDEVEGGSARQAKFLRLLGGKKGGASTGAPTTSHASKGQSDSTKAEAEIQKQFEAGMKMKNEGGSKRRGLGA
ncbi:Small acidic protein [Fusarium sp. LHS14.1]|nr:Small acidic protein [Fusarium sp. LHS14.1]